MGTKAISKLIYFFSIIISLLFVCITIVGALSQHADPSQHPTLGYIGVILPGLLIINLGYVFYWGIRRKLWILFSLMAIFANYEYITSMIQYSRVRETKDTTVKIATYNIHSFNNESTGYSAKQIAKYMKEEKVDVICMQEFNDNKDFTMDSLYNAFREYSYKYIPQLPKGGTRIAVFSKYPIIDSLFIPFSKSDNCGMWTDIQINNKPIRVFNVHMQTTSLSRSRSKLAKEMQTGDSEKEKEAINKMNEQLVNNSEKRANQAKLIRTCIDKTKSPILLCGDFNDAPTSFTYHELKGKLKDGFKTCGNGYGYTFRGLYNLLRIDYIFHSEALEGIEYYSPSLKWSDHNPVIMEVKL